MLKNIYKYIAILIITIILSIAFTGSHSVQSVDDLAYAVALGIDVGDTQNLKVTFQFTMPNSSGEGGSSGEAAPSVIDSVEATSLDNAINLMNTYVSKEVNLSHCKVIIISKELAEKGIGKEIYTLMNKVQIRPDNRIIITTCTAKEYIESVSPSLENLVAKFYEILPNSSEYTGYTINANLGDFFNKLVCKTCEPTAILGNIATQEDSKGSGSSQASGNSGSSQSSEGGGSSAGGSSGGSGGSESSESSENSGGSNVSGVSGGKESKALSAKSGIENIGVAVFKEDKLIGQLTAEETLAHLFLTNELKSCNISIPDPEDENKKIDLFLTHNHAPRIETSIVNGTPYIKASIKVNAKISSIDNMSKKMSEERLKQIEESASNYLKTLLSNYLYKTSKEFHSDIAGFGKYSLKEFKTNDEFEEYNWLNHYQDAFFDANANVTIKSGFLLTGT